MRLRKTVSGKCGRAAQHLRSHLLYFDLLELNEFTAVRLQHEGLAVPASGSNSSGCLFQGDECAA